MSSQDTYNTITISISVFSFLTSFFSVLFFSVYPCVKKKLINTAFVRMANFYKIYAFLNPWLLHGIEERANITNQLISQSFLAEGIPGFKHVISKEFLNFDPFSLQHSFWCEKLSWNEILYFNKFWKKSLKKINYIKHVLNKYDYLVKIDDRYKEINYRDSFSGTIIKSSVSLCPTFDDSKLCSFWFGPTIDYKEEKFDLNKIDEIEKNSKFIKELKSSKFSINLAFKTNLEDKLFSYSILFKNENPYKVEPFFHKQQSILDKAEQGEVIKHLDWIKKVFNIDSKNLLKEWPLTK